MTTEPVITTERIDDFPLLLAVMLQLGLLGIFDSHLKRHGLYQGLSWGWIGSIWLAHILTKSNHRKQPVQAWVKQAHETIEKISGQTVRDLDFTDDLCWLLAHPPVFSGLSDRNFISPSSFPSQVGSVCFLK